MSSREKFEQAIKARFGDLIDYRVCKNSDGEYMAWDMQVAWWAWQASEEAMAEQLANAESKCRELAAENSALNSVIEAVRGVADQSSGIAGWHLNGEIATWEEILPEIDNIKTPATDAYLKERGE